MELANTRTLAYSATGPSAGWLKLAQLVVRGLFKSFFRMEVVGREHIPRTQAIICLNHLGWSDSFPVLLHFPVQPRIFILGHRQRVLMGDIRARAIRTFQILVPLDPDKRVEATRRTLQILSSGASLLIYPEGRVGTQEGVLQPIQPGAAYLSLATGIPLIPASVTGTRELWLRRTITLRVGRPLQPATVADGPLKERVAALTTDLNQAMVDLLPGDHEQPRYKPLRDWLTRLFM